METKRLLNRAADLLVGIPMLLFGLFAIRMDVLAIIVIAEYGESMWKLGAGTLYGLAPLLVGCRLIFRRSRTRPTTHPDTL